MRETLMCLTVSEGENLKEVSQNILQLKIHVWGILLAVPSLPETCR